jgi:hypothetical protein
MPAELYGVITLKIGTRLEMWIMQHGQGRAGVEIRFKLDSDPFNSRILISPSQ